MHRRPLEQRLQEADLGYMMFIDPNQPVPLRNVAQFFTNAARDEGPDIGCRIVSESTLTELAFIGRVVLGATTPAHALKRVVAMMSYHSSHETVTLRQTPNSIVVGEGWTIWLDDQTLHTIHQFFASIIRMMCSLTRTSDPLLQKIEMVPHPELGFEHLEKWFNVPPEPSDDRSVRITIDRTIADRRFFRIARDRSDGVIAPGIEPLLGDGSLSNSVKTVLALHLSEGLPSVSRLAVSAGLSRRTLQRQLAAEGTSFSDLLEQVRREIALQHLEGDRGSLDDVAAKLGYARQSTLTRAVRRWTGQTPSTVRKGA